MFKIYITAVLFILFITLSLSYAKKASTVKIDIDSVKQGMKHLDLSIENHYSVSTENYFDYYKINYKDLKHSFGWFNSGNYKIASHVFLPKNPKGTIIILHGYFDHTGEIKTLIDLSLKLNYGVVTIDLPGHGLSGGERGAIDNFVEYSSTLENFINQYKSSMPKPFHIIGHSTGCAAVYEYLNNTKESSIDKIILLAPLVRSNYWLPSKFAFFILKPFVKKIPRKFTKNSGNKDYLKFVKNDPLEVRYISTRWFKALYNWNKKVDGYSPISNPVLIIQGDSDNTVAWKYNIKFLTKKLNRVNVKIIPNGRHQLPNESQEITEKVFKYIEDFLSG